MFFASTLSACHADLTFRFDFHPNNAVTITAREVIDDQLYQLAMSQASSSDPFGATGATQNGWTVKRTIDENENHVVTMTKDLTLDDFLKQGTNALPNASGKALAFDASAFQRVPGLFKDTSILHTTVPPVMPKQEADSSNPWAGAGAAMAASMIALHLEVKTPGKVIQTNGESTPDGYTRWDLNLQQPTEISYAVETLNYTHIAVAIVLGLAILIFLFALLLRGRRAARAFESS
ncbi:MAG TPA: hypothetical protein VGX91_05245 [Candidatus Cybelea sp.]|nr:hypothetical protein [Candidatus Cybelea sp.]